MPLSEILQKFNPLERQSPASELYLCLIISDEKVKSGIWSPSIKNAELLSFGSLESWSGESAEELIVVSDTSIATAISKLPEVSGSQPTKAILGLPEGWVEENSISKDKLGLLEKVCKKLLLKPQGFIVTAEAVANLLKKNEGGLPSIILANLGDTQVAVSLIIGGKFLGTKTVGRSDNLALDLEEGLLRFDYKDNLPSRILLLDGENLEQARQSLLAYPWISPEGEKKLHFLQLPKVELPLPNLEVAAVIYASNHEFMPAGDLKAGEITKQTEAVLEEQGEAEEVLDEQPAETILAEEDFGFVKGADISQNQSLKVEESAELETKEVIVEEEPKVVARQPSETFGKKLLKSFKQGKAKFLGVISSFRFPLLFNKLILLPLLAILVFGLIAFGVLMTIKSEVKLVMNAQKIEKEFDFSVSSKVSSVDVEKMILPAKEITVEISGNKTSNVSGKKTVGDEAKGEVVVYNGTDKTKKFPKGTVIRGPGDLKFVLDAEMTVASKTADLKATPPVEKWGECRVAVTAQEIGTQYNLAADSNLFLEGVSNQFLTKNPSAFSGGTSREIQAVSKEDRDNLERELNKEFEERAEMDIKGKIAEGDYLLSSSLQLKSKTNHFNHELGDEVTDLALEGKSQFSALYFRQEDFSALADKIISPLILEGYKKTPVREDKKFEPKDKSKGVYTAKVTFESLPEIDIGSITKNIKLKTSTQAEKYLREINQVAGVTIMIKPRIFSKINLMPLREENITVTIKPA